MVEESVEKNSVEIQSVVPFIRAADKNEIN